MGFELKNLVFCFEMKRISIKAALNKHTRTHTHTHTKKKHKEKRKQIGHKEGFLFCSASTLDPNHEELVCTVS